MLYVCILYRQPQLAMLKIFCAYAAIIFILGCTISPESKFNFVTSNSLSQGNQETEVVYICTGKSSEVYHDNKKCMGLSNCRKDIVEVSKGKAVNEFGRRPCKRCY
jgi:hypothetical protein